MPERMLLFIPMYNSWKQVCRMLGQLDEGGLTYVVRVIIVDDHSSDNSEKTVREYLVKHPDIPAVLVRNTHNYGQEGPLKVALKYAIENGFEYMISILCDDPTNEKNKLLVLREGIYQSHDFSMGGGKRNARRYKFIGCPRFRKFGNRGQSPLFITVLGRKLLELGTCLKIYKPEVVKSRQTPSDGRDDCGFEVLYETKKKPMRRPKVFVLDVDGVLTDGGFYYTVEGKVAKKFGADDNDALSLLRPYLEIVFVTGDKRGFSISKKRIEDMHFQLELVSTIKRIDWIRERYDPQEVIYMGDGIFDHYVMREVGYGISTCDGDSHAKKYANYVTARTGGHRAVAEASLHIMERFFQPYNEMILPAENINYARDWTV